MRDGWDTALDAQNDLRHSFQTDEGQRFMAGYADSLRGSASVTHPDGSTGLTAADADQIVQVAADTVELGDPIYVSDDVCELIEFAGETLRPEAIFPEDIIIADGFAYFARPRYLVDRHGKRLSYRALSWAQSRREDNPGQTGVAIALWSDFADDDDYVADFRPLRLIGGSRLALSHVTNIPYGSQGVLQVEENHQFLRQVEALWKMMAQEIVLPGQERVSRPTWRSRSNWRQIKHVTVLTLRRARYHRPDGEVGEVEWSHRWLVRGHWRNQRYKGPDGEWFYSQIWIAPFIKGPEDKPFVPKRRAVEFVR